ncbi:glycosyltransferase family 4 protein [Rhizobium sp. LjRoot254]|uniref:glycosyltransferase family 4 protein n=1 Tax=Rhizobium sp. LjRoot254 TaxID=3342297 RepID=UPI003ECDB48F
MRVAFYSPLKSPRHPVPSGDRLMARLLIVALERAGATVDIASELRSFSKEPSEERLAALKEEAAAETSRIARAWRHEALPDLWFTYHSYYKAPDLLGPALVREFSIPYVTAEASLSARRDRTGWGGMQAPVIDAVAMAAVNICMTARDRIGLMEMVPRARMAVLPPFLDASAFLSLAPSPDPTRLVTVAMMRPGDKMDSYRMLAASLALIGDLDWTLEIVGDGPSRPEVEALFAGFAPGRIVWHGERDQREIAAILSRAGIYVWPGCGEAYGLAYLEAQAAGLPVVAQAIAGVPEVVIDDRTGLLTAPGDVAAYADAIRTLLVDGGRRAMLAANARQFVEQERSLDRAAARLAIILKEFTGLPK